MVKYKEGQFIFDLANKEYEVTFHGIWLLDGPEGYEAWLEESLQWNLYDNEGREMSQNSLYNNIWITAEKELTIRIDQLDFNKEKRK